VVATLPDTGHDRQGPTDAGGRFVLLYTRHQREIRAYIAALVGNWAEADEVMAETSLALWNQFDRYDPTRSFGAWACGVAFHRVLRRRRALGRDRHEFGGAFEAAAERAAARMESDADRLGARTAALESCLGKLPEADRGLLESAYRGDSTIRDLAGRLGRPAKAVYKTLARIRAVLVACVEKTLAEADDFPPHPEGRA
jgi:RNA polymerase sigma-70 factor (ECF subfamily)